MFSIEYLIPNEVKHELRKDPIAYVEDLGNIEGQIHITIKNQHIGWVSKKITFGRELLELWFRFLNNLAIKLPHNRYVALIIPETSQLWIDFSRNFTYTKVRLLECEHFTSLPYQVITDPNFLTILKIRWEEEIDLDSITREIFAKTSKFIDEVLAYDPKLSEVYPIKNLIESRYIPG